MDCFVVRQKQAQRPFHETPSYRENKLLQYLEKKSNQIVVNYSAIFLFPSIIRHGHGRFVPNKE